MKKGWYIVILVGLAALWFIRVGNNIVTKEEAVTQSWAQVENVYQRRADLIPNLVNTVKGAADFERNTLEAVMEARAKATQTTIDPTNLTEESMAAFQSAQDGLSSALSRMMVVVERYPELKANENFLELQAQLEGTENRITVERRNFNTTTQDFNTYIRKFPASLVARIRGFSQKAYFKAAEGSDVAPVVAF